MLQGSLDDIISGQNALLTCDTEMRLWDAPARSILDMITEEDAESDDDDEVHVTQEDDPCTIEDTSAAIAHMQIFKKYAIEQGLSKILGAISDIESCLGEELLKQKRNVKQTKVTDFFAVQ